MPCLSYGGQQERRGVRAAFPRVLVQVFAVLMDSFKGYIEVLKDWNRRDGMWGVVLREAPQAAHALYIRQRHSRCPWSGDTRW